MAAGRAASKADRPGATARLAAILAGHPLPQSRAVLMGQVERELAGAQAKSPLPSHDQLKRLRRWHDVFAAPECGAFGQKCLALVEMGMAYAATQDAVAGGEGKALPLVLRVVTPLDLLEAMS
ncbi:MAG: hypothetical protein FJX52_17145, partial [Alphaproteobacteria bacterium]|nr:hypothetical protein [Alphaproteobacteria bacterium]